MGNSDRFLVNFIHGFSHRQLFFFVWVLVVGGFVWMMVNYLKKGERRNFRPDSQGPRRSTGTAVSVQNKSGGLEKTDRQN